MSSNTSIGDLFKENPKYVRQMDNMLTKIKKHQKEKEREQTPTGSRTPSPTRYDSKNSYRQIKTPSKGETHLITCTKKAWRTYAKWGRHSFQILPDTGADLTTCSILLAKVLGIKWEPFSSDLTVVTLYGKSPVKGIVRDAKLRMLDANISIDVNIVDSKEEIFLLGRDWMRRYEAIIDFDNKKLTFKAQGRRFETTVTEVEVPYRIAGQDTTRSHEYRASYGEIEEASPPPPYRANETPTIITIGSSSDEEEEESEYRWWLDTVTEVTPRPPTSDPPSEPANLSERVEIYLNELAERNNYQ